MNLNAEITLHKPGTVRALPWWQRLVVDILIIAWLLVGLVSLFSYDGGIRIFSFLDPWAKGLFCLAYVAVLAAARKSQRYRYLVILVPMTVVALAYLWAGFAWK